MEKKLYLDFDNIFQQEVPPSHYIVLTSSYTNESTININKFDFRESAYVEFESYCSAIEEQIEKSGYFLSLYKVLLFNNCFYPFAKWILCIRDLLEQNKINTSTEIIFSTYYKNPRVFLLEAEGEVNRQFLYKPSYFLGYYILLYCQNIGFTNITLNQKSVIKVNISQWTRTRLILILKTTLLCFYKVFTFKRTYIKNINNFRERKIIFSSRGVIQSNFIKNLYNERKDEMAIFINEASSSPFSNLKLAKKNFDNFYYAEGNLKWKDLYKRFAEVYKIFSFKQRITGCFFDVPFNFSDIFYESSLLDFHMKTYADSVNRSIEVLKMKEIKKVVSFEMLSPFSHYLRSEIGKFIVQIQTTLLANHKSADFVYADKFYFYSKEALQEQTITNHHFSAKFDYLDNLKYLNILPQKRKENFSTLYYFTQPIYLDEEHEIIRLLSRFAKKYNKTLKIVLHPRSVPSSYSEFRYSEFVKGNSIDVIKDADLVVTRTSSIGLDCWHLNVPVLFFVNNMFKDFFVDYIPHDYLGTITTNIDEDWIAANIASISDNFYNHPYHTYIKNVSHDKVEEIFSDSLNSIK